MTLQTQQSFNAWLRGQLKEKKMSQRQLALQSGVDHSTISRLIKGDRMPSLGTATKLARGLREISDEAEGPAYFASLSSRPVLPTSRVEYALRGDDALSESDVRELMQAYIIERIAIESVPSSSVITTGRLTIASVSRIATCGWLITGVARIEP